MRNQKINLFRRVFRYYYTVFFGFRTACNIARRARRESSRRRKGHGPASPKWLAIKPTFLLSTFQRALAGWECEQSEFSSDCGEVLAD